MSECGPYATEDDAIDAYDELLNEVYPEVQIGGLSFRPSDILHNCDPIAHNVGFNDWLDSVLEDYEEDEEDGTEG